MKREIGDLVVEKFLPARATVDLSRYLSLTFVFIQLSQQIGFLQPTAHRSLEIFILGSVRSG